MINLSSMVPRVKKNSFGQKQSKQNNQNACESFRNYNSVPPFRLHLTISSLLAQQGIGHRHIEERMSMDGFSSHRQSLFKEINLLND